MMQATGSKHHHSSSNHSVVHIGGAPFIPPLATMFQEDPLMRKDASGSSLSASMSSTPSSSSSAASSSPHTSPPASPSYDTLESSRKYEAARRYSNAMLDHTQKMWQRERSTIERARAELADKAEAERIHDSSDKKGFASDALDVIFRRKSIGSGQARGGRRHQKSSSLAY